MLTAERTISGISDMAETLIGSEIIKLANDINELIRNGAAISNLTIGDFDPAVFPIPEALLQQIIEAYRQGHTNYPVASGMPELRKTVSRFIQRTQQLDYSSEEILITGGARPAIYGIYKTLVDPGDMVIYPVPSWNNNHYCHLALANGVMIETLSDHYFMPEATQLKPYITKARLIALCSPLNPTGTVFNQNQLAGICELVLEENERRKKEKTKPLYVLYDQVYSALLFSGVKHYDPVSLFPEMRHYTLFVDGISKSFAATGIRVGWAFGPEYIINRMGAILSHVGAWAPRAEQIAVTAFLNNSSDVDTFLNRFRQAINMRLQGFYRGFQTLKAKGYPVECIAPQAAIYLTVKFDLKGKKNADGNLLQQQSDVTAYLLKEAAIALVPFSAFGSSSHSPWYRLSVGTWKSPDEIPAMIEKMDKALSRLH
jgi:aspartate aminotransferase